MCLYKYQIFLLIFVHFMCFYFLSHKNYEEAQKTVYVGDWQNCSVPSVEVRHIVNGFANELKSLNESIQLY